MSDEPNPSGEIPQSPQPSGPQSNGHDAPAAAPAAAPEPAPKPKSLRAIAEEVYDELAAPAAPEPDAGQSGQPRDSLGRYAARREAVPGEADGDVKKPPTQPRPDDQQVEPPHPAPSQDGRSSEAPANWTAADRDAFAKQTEEGKAFLLRRHSEMESDYQRRVQATRGAAEFTQALLPVFQDPVLAGSLMQSKASPFDAIVQWAGFHKRAVSPNVGDRLSLLQEMASRMGIDPAAIATSRPGPGQLTKEDLDNPAIRHFADAFSRQSSETQQLRAIVQQLQDGYRAQQQEQQVRVARWSVDSFAEEKGSDGKPLHPYYDEVINEIIMLYRINPEREMPEAYETACRMNPVVNERIISDRIRQYQQQNDNQRAVQAVRSNVRGLTAPVAKPALPAPKGLRSLVTEIADEIGLQ